MDFSCGARCFLFLLLLLLLLPSLSLYTVSLFAIVEKKASDNFSSCLFACDAQGMKQKRIKDGRKQAIQALFRCTNHGNKYGISQAYSETSSIHYIKLWLRGSIYYARFVFVCVAAIADINICMRYDEDALLCFALNNKRKVRARERERWRRTVFRVG